MQPPPGYGLGDFFMGTNRTTYLIDGFNLYHSVVDASIDLAGATTKWLNIKSLCESYLQIWGKDHALEEIFYFSALATHCEPNNPGVVARHQTFISCIQSTGVIVELARFKEKQVYCRNCKKYTTHHEEKETDVALAIKILELCVRGKCDTIVVVTGDTDIAPAIRTARILYPHVGFRMLFPYKRKNKELAQLCPGSAKIKAAVYTGHQFPDPFTLTDGTTLAKPPTW